MPSRDAWIDDPEPDDDEPDLDGLCSDPVGVIEDQFLIMILRLRQEGYSRVEIMAGLSLATTDLAHEMLG